MTKETSLAVGSSSLTRSRPPVVSQSATVDPLTWLTTRPAGIRDGDFARESLQDFDANGGGYLTHVLAEADDLRHARANPQRLVGPPIVNFSLPPHRQRLIRMAERRPAALVRRFRMLGDEAAGD